MKNLIVYYSLSGNTKFVANAIAKYSQGDILQLKQKKEFKPNSFTKYFKGGKQVLFKIKPELVHWDINLSEYDLIFVGSPVWAGSYVPAFNTFFSKENVHNKKIVLFSTWGGSAGNVFVNLKNSLKENNCLDEIGFREPLKQTAEAQSQIEDQISDFVKNLNLDL